MIGSRTNYQVAHFCNDENVDIQLVQMSPGVTSASWHNVALSWNPTGPTLTPTPTLGMRLSCNVVNVYTIVYHVQYTYTCTRALPQRTSSRGKARVSDKSPRTSRRGSSCVSGWMSSTGLACRGRPTAARAGHEDPRAEVGEEVRVGVGVRVGPVEFKLYATWNDF